MLRLAFYYCGLGNSGKGPKAFSSAQQSSACYLLADDSKSWAWDLGVFVLAFRLPDPGT
ncbi:hypothetical protein K0M31_008799 [Melipona bicolor]|uniref:Uncharacterized protein n=1 Tax=Melipona bicolor TaxID=60889 RepID=A0AA40KJX2_9HYME|nr:hypothetical protein K0M31_008799 [Melipona bicolor]